ncbi:cupin-like domain-containing protein [Sphingomonas sp. PB2P12]|uniref:cupin-like domain-containing protein n=1 Tax=Sphingomonas sandaracina TaxID=3096157 RepID=UPI002FC6E560
MATLPSVRTIEGAARADVDISALIEAGEPVVLKAIAADLPLVEAGRRGVEAAMAYLLQFDAGRPVVGFVGAPNIGGRFFYNADLTGMNYTAGRAPLADFLERIRANISTEAPESVYLGSTDLDVYFPGLRADNPVVGTDVLAGSGASLASLWIGNRTTAAAHWDMSNNIACPLVGRRRFTLFPPDQVANLYPGPLEPTPGGQMVSMVDFPSPDYARYPGFRNALAAARVAELDPGDVLVYPALWWHQVEALDDFNVMVNYWWNDAPAFVDTPMTTLLHALLSLRDRPVGEKQAWRAMFDYYVFGPADRAGEHLPPHARGALGTLDDMAARRLRAQVQQRLNR